MTLPAILSYCFLKWWRPLLFTGFTTLLFWISDQTHTLWFQNLGFYMLCAGMLTLLIAATYQFIRGRWKDGLASLALLILLVVGLIYYALTQFLADQGKPDHFADNLKIPSGIAIYSPVPDFQADQDSILHSTKKPYGFQLYSSMQPGIYEYSIWLPRTEPGKVYIRAFEITQETALSTTRLPEASSIPVKNSGDPLLRFFLYHPFTIFEGDWGKPYAARFEVWFVPEKGGPERKLTEKNYKIEGWMR